MGATSVPVRVSIVDDSVVIRGLFSRWLSALPDVEIAGIHRNGLEAVRQIGHIRPDIVLLDIEMPEMDGLTALPLLLEASPGSRVLVVSAMSARGADLALRCIMRGAVDFLAKPSTLQETGGLDEFRSALLDRVRGLGVQRAPGTDAGPAARPAAGSALAGGGDPGRAAAVRAQTAVRPPPRLVVIGASTGGPNAITHLVRALKPAIGAVPIIVAQQMPAMFSAMFADLVGRQAGVQAQELKDGDTVAAGTLHICRGGQDLSLVGRGGSLMAVGVGNGQATFSRPSLDRLFAGAAAACQGDVLGVVLTGIGRDGVEGARAIVEAGGQMLVQDQASSVVWGMPGAVAQAGLGAEVLGLDAIAERILRAVLPPGLPAAS